MKKMNTGAMFAATAVLMMVMGAFAVPQQASAEAISLDSQIDTEDGVTDLLGGGDKFFVRFGNDAAFGIVWGVEGNENYVYFVTVKARYLGLAQVYNNDGENIDDSREMKLYTMYAVKLDSVLEFDDEDENGILNYTRDYSGERFEDYDYAETVYKKVDLMTAWNASDIIEVDDDDGRAWDFSLTAVDLPYELVDESAEAEVGDGVLNEFRLSFRVEADLAQMDGISMPQWRVTVAKGPFGNMTFMTADRLENIQVTGKILKYDVKWDQAIEGWDFDPGNANPSVLIEFHSIMGNFVSPHMATWMEMRMVSYMNAVGVMNCATRSGDLEIDETTGTLVQPKELIRTRVNFGSDWSAVGELTWVDHATVDGEPATVKAQVMGGHEMLATARVGGEWKPFTGFVTLGAMVFPGGNSVVHDPTFSSEALVEYSVDKRPGIPVLLLLVAAAVVIVVGVVAAASSGGRKPKRGSQDPYERARGQQPNDWTKYYDRK